MKKYKTAGKSYYYEKQIKGFYYGMLIFSVPVVICVILKSIVFTGVALIYFAMSVWWYFMVKYMARSDQKSNYVYRENVLELYYGKKLKKTLEYNKVKIVVICNAAEQFSTRYGVGWYTAGYGIDKETFFQYAEIVLFESYDCVNFLQAGLYNCNLCSYWHGEKSISRDYINYYARIAEKNMTDLGICDFESLRELLLRTSANVYILGDVYFRFQKELDAVIQETDGEQKVYLVLGNKDVVLYQYAKADAVRKDLSIAEAYKRIFPVKARYLITYN